MVGCRTFQDGVCSRSAPVCWQASLGVRCDWDKNVLPHHTNRHAACASRQCYAKPASQWINIDLTAVFPCLFEKRRLALVFLTTFAQRILQPRIEVTGVNPQTTAHRPHGKLRAMLDHKHVPQPLPGRRCLHRREGCIYGEVRGGLPKKQRCQRLMALPVNHSQATWRDA